MTHHHDDEPRAPKTCQDCGAIIPISRCVFGCDDWRQIEEDRQAGPDADVVELLQDAGIGWS